jgi:hypothetical protein
MIPPGNVATLGSARGANAPSHREPLFSEDAGLGSIGAQQLNLIGRRT